ncbi:hypothetical protein RSAG8_12030, partial [Rhizoctonia solani AG-8 WAC10335]
MSVRKAQGICLVILGATADCIGVASGEISYHHAWYVKRREDTDRIADSLTSLSMKHRRSEDRR